MNSAPAAHNTLPEAPAGRAAARTMGERLRSIRKSRGLSQIAIGRVAGMTSQAIGYIESGDTAEPGAKPILKICDRLKVDPFWLVLGRTSSATKPDLFAVELCPENTAIYLELVELLSKRALTASELKLLQASIGVIRTKPGDEPI